MGKDPTPGEQRLEAYLDHWAASYKFEPDLGHRKQPDYLLRTPHGPVLLEVSDFRPDEHDAAIAKTLDERRKSLGPYSYSSAGGVGPDYVPKVRDKIEEELAQLKPFHEAYGCIVVLLNLRVLLSLDPHDLVPAMAEVLQRDYRRVPSAIAVLGSTRPREHYRTRHLRGLEKDGAIAKPPAPTRRGGLRHPPRDDLIRALEALDALNREWGPAMGEEYPQLVVFHNPLAARRLRPSALPGVYDRHFKIVLDNDVGIILQRVLVPQRYIPR